MNNKDYRPFSASIYSFFNEFEDNNPAYGLIPMHVRMFAVYLCTAPERHKSGLITLSVRTIEQNIGLDRKLIFPTLEQLADIPYTSHFRDYNGQFVLVESGKVFMPFLADLTLQGKQNKWLYNNIYQPIKDGDINERLTPNIFASYCDFWADEIYQHTSEQTYRNQHQQPTTQEPTKEPTQTLQQILEAEEARLKEAETNNDVQNAYQNVTPPVTPEVEQTVSVIHSNDSNILQSEHGSEISPVVASVSFNREHTNFTHTGQEKQPNQHSPPLARIINFAPA